MEFKREHTLLHKLVIVDGSGKCGKSLLMDVISCFQGVEKKNFNSFMEYIALAYKYNKISSDIAITILKTEMDTELYNNMIGRYINTRLTDDTSLYKYHSPSKYLQRALGEDGRVIYDKVLSEKPIYLCWSHDLINKADIIFEAFNSKLEFIYLNRNPIDIIYEWSQHQYTERMAQDPTEMQYCIKYKNTTVPEIARGWEEEFLCASPMERTVKTIYTLFKLNKESLLKNYKNNHLHIINFESLVTDPYSEVKKLENIICNEPLAFLDDVLFKAKCPRKINTNELIRREIIIKEHISHSYVELLSVIKDMYEDIKRLDKNKFL